jgi:hypothetical protein
MIDMAAKRCQLCKKKLDEKGRCQNHDCVDYKRTLILEEADKQKEEENNNSSEQP